MRIIFLLVLALGLAQAQDLKLGIIGTDNSRAAAVTKLLNDPQASGHVGGAKVVAAYRLAASAAKLCPQVDGILLEDADGETHLSQFREIVRCGKPVFIDSPLASTLEEARAIAELAAKSQVPWFSASGWSFGEVENMNRSGLAGVTVRAPGPKAPDHQGDFMRYTVPGLEILYTIMGTGCVEISRTATGNQYSITGHWSDGRLGAVSLGPQHLGPAYGNYTATEIFKNNTYDERPNLHANEVSLLKKIVEFMRAATPPVPNQTTLEMYAFLDAWRKSILLDIQSVKLVP